MQPLKLAVGLAWIVFWIYWLASASTSKESVAGGWRTRLTAGDRAGQQPARPDRRRGAGRVLLLLRARRGAEPLGHLPHHVPEYRSRTKMLIPFLL